MTRLDILIDSCEKLYDQENVISERIDGLNKRKDNEMKLVLQKFIDTYDFFKVNYFADKVSVYAKEGNYSLLDMYVYDEWVDDKRTYNRIDFSTSSFRTEFGRGNDMKWADERFKMLAFYSKVLSDFSDDILAEMNVVNDKYRGMCRALYENARPIRKQINELNKMISEIKDENMMAKLMSEDGLMIVKNEEDSYLPTFQVKFDWELYSVKSIRGLKKSASGKSVDLEVAVRRGYGDDKKLEVIKVDRVRFDNVKRFINRNLNSFV